MHSDNVCDFRYPGRAPAFGRGLGSTHHLRIHLWGYQTNTNGESYKNKHENTPAQCGRLDVMTSSNQHPRFSQDRNKYMYLVSSLQEAFRRLYSAFSLSLIHI